MGMGFAPTWLRLVSPLIHKTTLTTAHGPPWSAISRPVRWYCLYHRCHHRRPQTHNWPARPQFDYIVALSNVYTLYVRYTSLIMIATSVGVW